jgi:hypothetical protein
MKQKEKNCQVTAEWARPAKEHHQPSERNVSAASKQPPKIKRKSQKKISSRLPLQTARVAAVGVVSLVSGAGGLHRKYSTRLPPSSPL